MTDKEEMLEYVKRDAEDNDYYVCPDEELLDDLLDGLVKNAERYGYPSCPCREASGVKTYDSDIICPCEYRDADVEEFGMCYCGLFVSKEVADDPSKMEPIPERRPPEVTETAMEVKEEGISEKKEVSGAGLMSDEEDVKIWRCTVCGYLAAREDPPPVCPICKAKAERFEEFEDFG
ncbi:MAG: ferredoxin:glutaredoxin reductase [Candidatus Thermoplasmatota archaeon]|nr:ferredoxin:glutaredoxin reductase [Candidatus Thermoplasmatota archaeon]